MPPTKPRGHRARDTYGDVGRIIEKPRYIWGDHEGNNAKSEVVMAAEPRRRYARVADADGHQWERGNTRWTCLTPVGTRGVTQVGRLPWSILVTEYGPLTVIDENLAEAKPARTKEAGTVPPPPEGYATAAEVGIKAGIRGDEERRLLVWAEGAWRPLIGLGKKYGTTIEVTYEIGPAGLPTSMRGQRVIVERIAVPEGLGNTRLMIARRAQAKLAEEQAQRDADRAAALAALAPKTRREVAEREVAVAEQMVEFRRDAVERAQEELAKTEEKLAAALRQLAELDEEG